MYDDIKQITEALNVMNEKKQRLNPVFPADDKQVLDGKSHFPLGSVAQARNALARANQYDASPKWFKGTLKELKKRVADTVKKEFPSIEVSEESYK